MVYKCDRPTKGLRRPDNLFQTTESPASLLRLHELETVIEKAIVPDSVVNKRIA